MNSVKIELTAEEWGQVMMVLQAGVYRTVAPLLMRMNEQLVGQLQARAAPPKPRVGRPRKASGPISLARPHTPNGPDLPAAE